MSYTLPELSREEEEELEGVFKRRLFILGALTLACLVGLIIISGFTADAFLCSFFIFAFSGQGLVLAYAFQESRVKKARLQEIRGETLFQDSWGGFEKYRVLKDREVLAWRLLLLSIPILNFPFLHLWIGEPRYYQVIVILNLGFFFNPIIVLTYFFGRRFLEETTFIEVTTRGVIIDGSQTPLLPRESISRVISFPGQEKYTNFLFGVENLHVRDVSGFLQALERLFGEDWKDIYLDLGDPAVAGELLFSEAPLDEWDRIPRDWLGFLERFIGNEGPKAAVAVLVNFTLELFLLVLFLPGMGFSPLQSLAIFLLINGFIALELFILYWKRDKGLGQGGVELTSTRLGFTLLSGITAVVLQYRGEENNFYSMERKDGTESHLEIRDVPGFLAAMKQAMGPRWEEVYVDNVDKVKGHPRYSTLEDKGGFRSCPVCDIALPVEARECPLCELKFREPSGSLENSSSEPDSLKRNRERMNKAVAEDRSPGEQGAERTEGESVRISREEKAGEGT